MGSPVPRTRNRASGWTAERQAAFLVALAESGCVEIACGVIGLSPSSAYRLRRQPRGAAFAVEWDIVLAARRDRLADEVFERINDRREPIRYRGRIVGDRVIASNRLLISALRIVATGNRGPSNGR